MLAESVFEQEMTRQHLETLADSKPDITREYTIPDLLRKVNPLASIDPLAEEFVLDMVDDFIDSIVLLAAQVAKNRGSATVQAEDVAFVLQRKFGDEGLGGAKDLKKCPEFVANEAHIRRLNAVLEAQKQNPNPV
jgi:histone H3/H4